VSPKSCGVKSRLSSAIHLGVVDADLIHNVKMIGHLGAARVIAAAGANFLIRSWLDARIKEELASGSER
jgi:hypothetical protein